MNEPIKVVITGGPHAGKTTILERLHVDFGNVASFVPESATILLEGGYPAPPTDASARDSWLADMQGVVVALQLQLEAMATKEAMANGHKLVVLDRSLGDLPAYHPKGYEAVLRQLKPYGINTLAGRYHHILHLHSLATLKLGEFSRSGNASRYETRAEAVRIDRRVRRSNEWLAINRFYDILPAANFVSKYSQVRDIIADILVFGS